MGVDVSVEQRISRPREQVAAFAMDPANDTRWIGALSSVRVLTDGPVAVGTQVERVAGFLGREMTYVNEIAEIEPGRRLAMRSVKAPFQMTVVYEFQDAPDDGTLVRILAAGEAGRYYRLAGPLLPLMVRRGIRRDLRRLRGILESS